MFKSIQGLFHPDQFQGWEKNKKYFEGWYFKVVNADESKALAFIPGIAMDENGLKQAFIQVIDGKKRTAEYHKFDANEFRPHTGFFELTIGQNFFSNDKIRLDLPTAAGQLHFSNQTPWPNSFLHQASWGLIPLFLLWNVIMES